MQHFRRKIQVTVIGLIAFLPALGFAQNDHPIHQVAVAEAKPNHETGGELQSTGNENPVIPEKDWPAPEADSRFGTLLLEQFEYRFNEGADTFVWDAQGWYGGDYTRLWFKTEGTLETKGNSGGEAEFQLLYSRLIAPFWDFQAGIRVDQVWGSPSDPSRVLAVIGIQGLAPYRFEVEPTLFFSEAGGVSARLTATMDLLITQKLILQPRLETEIASRREEKFGIGQGLEYVDLGLRLRYELKREFAPYIGISWVREFGETADISRGEGNRDNTFSAVTGLRLRF